MAARRNGLKLARFVFVPLLGIAGTTVPAAAHDAIEGVESSPSMARAGNIEQEGSWSRWKGSILLFDQSMTTQTAAIGSDYQSYDPTYEWWVAFKPRYTAYERERDSISLNLWLNFYLELTNSDTTTLYREPLVGPTYLWATYGHLFRNVNEYKTTATIGPRVVVPTDKGAYDSGQLIGLGAIGSVSQTFRLAGHGARAMNSARLAVGAIYTHPFDRSSSPVNSDLHQLREDVDGRTVISDQLSGQMNVRDVLSLSLLADLQMLRRLRLSLSYVVVDSWIYAPPDAQICITTGCVTPTSIPDPSTFRVNTWVTAEAEYDLGEALSVSVGYYNLANQLAPDGTRRDPLWSPSARLFLTLTSNLDVIYRRLAQHNRG
jgi:hypothetical protein